MRGRGTWRLKKWGTSYQIIHTSRGLWRGEPEGSQAWEQSDIEEKEEEGRGANSRAEPQSAATGGAHLAPQSYPWNAVMRVGLQEKPASWPRPPPPDPHWHTFLPGLHFDAHKENANHLSMPSFNLLLQAWQKGHESNLTILPSRSWGHSGSWKRMGCRTQEPWSHYASACISPFTFTSGLWGNRSQRPVGSSQEHRLWCGTP